MIMGCESINDPQGTDIMLQDTFFETHQIFEDQEKILSHEHEYTTLRYDGQAEV